MLYSLLSNALNGSEFWVFYEEISNFTKGYRNCHASKYDCSIEMINQEMS